MEELIYLLIQLIVKGIRNSGGSGGSRGQSVFRRRSYSKARSDRRP